MEPLLERLMFGTRGHAKRRIEFRPGWRENPGHMIFMPFRRLRFAFSPKSILLPSEVDALEVIREKWMLHRGGHAPGYHEIIVMALRRMQQDLDSDCRSEVIEDVQREIVYREWCTGNDRSQAVPNKPVQPVPHGPGSG